MISLASVSCTTSPSSLTQEKSRYSTRSNPSCRMASNFPLPSRFRSSMQNIGGAFGFSTETAVLWILARSAEAEISNFSLPSRLRNAKINSSLAG